MGRQQFWRGSLTPTITSSRLKASATLSPRPARVAPPELNTSTSRVVAATRALTQTIASRYCVLDLFATLGYRPKMPDRDKLTRVDPSDLVAALAFALRFHGRKRVHSADEMMAEIVARRLVEHLDRAGFVVMQRPAEVGAAALGRGSRE